MLAIFLLDVKCERDNEKFFYVKCDMNIEEQKKIYLVKIA